MIMQPTNSGVQGTHPTRSSLASERPLLRRRSITAHNAANAMNAAPTIARIAASLESAIWVNTSIARAI